VTAPPITPVLCKAARKLVGWNVLDLARRAGTEPLELVRFEGHQGMLSLDKLTAVRSTFEAAGVEFPDGAPRMRGER
jgi:hypothetical protein